MVALIAILIFSLSLCADCFAVSVCSSITLKSIDTKTVLPIAITFGIVQSGFMLAGWLFGDLFVGYVEKVAHIIGFLLLLYVGGSMLKEAFEKESEVRNLNGIRNVILGAIATSIDALAVGISLSMSGDSPSDVVGKAVGVLIVTFLSVVVGMFAGHKIGNKFGKIAEGIGGVVLIAIGLNILLL
ncbi:MAG: manganese efflux pump MntP family protein [Bacteroidales bacterium]|nr:manganese efflux pump MntP family protein [Bacteroidales bacterium]